MITFAQRIENIQSVVKKKDLLKQQIQSLDESITNKSFHLQTLASVKQVFVGITMLNQKHIKERIEKITTLALQLVFGDAYFIELEVKEKKTGNAVSILLKKEDTVIDFHSCSGGVLDVLSLGLRIALWSLKKTASVFILDEPFRNLSADYQKNASAMTRELAEKLGIQFIIVTYNEALIQEANHIITME